MVVVIFILHSCTPYNQPPAHMQLTRLQVAQCQELSQDWALCSFECQRTIASTALLVAALLAS